MAAGVDDDFTDPGYAGPYPGGGDGNISDPGYVGPYPGTSGYDDSRVYDGIEDHGLWSMQGMPQFWQENGEGEYGMWPGDNWGMDVRGAGQQRRGGSSPGRQKRRFCTSFPEVGLCRRGEQCVFAHTREEVRAPLLDTTEERQDPPALTDEFFMFKYKTLWCPIGVQHEWHTCVYAHNYQDARRPVSIGYGARLCPYWKRKDTCAEYFQRCPLGLRCPFAHGAKEQLYHPQYFKTVICRDLRNKACPRHRLCAFFHHRAERRTPPADDVDYSQPLSEDSLPEKWVSEFLSPPFTPENGHRDDGMPGQDGPGVASYSSQDAAQYPQGPMQPAYFYLMPANNIDGSIGNQGDMGMQMMPVPVSLEHQQSSDHQ